MKISPFKNARALYPHIKPGLDRLSAVVKFFDLRDAFVFSGMGAVYYGLFQIYPPAAWIVLGVALFWLGVKQ